MAVQVVEVLRLSVNIVCGENERGFYFWNHRCLKTLALQLY